MFEPKWLSKKLQSSIEENPKIKINDITEKAEQKWNAGITKSKAVKARCIEKDIVDGSVF